MLLVTFGLLFGLGTILWCVAVSILQSQRGDRDVGRRWGQGNTDVEEAHRTASPAWERRHVA